MTELEDVGCIGDIELVKFTPELLPDVMQITQFLLTENFYLSYFLLFGLTVLTSDWKGFKLKYHKVDHWYHAHLKK